MQLEVRGAVVEGVDEVHQIGTHSVGTEFGGRAAVVSGQLSGTAQILGARHLGHAFEEQISFHAITQLSHATPPVWLQACAHRRRVGGGSVVQPRPRVTS